MKEVEKRFPNPTPFSDTIPPEVACLAQMDIEREDLVKTLDEVRVALNGLIGSLPTLLKCVTRKRLRRLDSVLMMVVHCTTLLGYPKKLVAKLNG